MVIAINIYKFELNANERGDINPEFRLFVAEIAQENKDIPVDSLITTNDQFALMHSASTSISTKIKDKAQSVISLGRLKETNYKVISFFRQDIDESQWEIVAFFKLDDEVELFENILQQMEQKLEPIFEKLMAGNFKDMQFISEIQGTMQKEIKFTLFQVERLSNLSKTQKVGLIYASPERVKTIELLRQGPISRKKLTEELEKVKDHPNVDTILSPFIELNIIRRDWARGFKDRKGIIRGEGEYIFLVKDVALLRAPPSEALADGKNNPVGSAYKAIADSYYGQYDPFTDLGKIVEESKALAKFLLDPDMYDFLALLRTKPYPLAKLPKITSEFANTESLLGKLQGGNVVKVIQDPQSKDWVCLLADIVPMVVFPDYMTMSIKSRMENIFKAETIAKSQGKEMIPVDTDLTPEVAQRGLDLLETTYNEKIEF